MKRIALIFLALIYGHRHTVAQKPALHPFDTLQYDRAVAYDYNGMNDNPIVKDGQLIRRAPGQARSVEIYGQQQLTKLQIAAFHKILRDTATFGGPTAACFDPHLGIVYYKREKIVGHISVCISCNFLRSSMLIPASHSKKIYYSDDPNNYLWAEGFSQQARERLNNFCKELQFTTCTDSLQHHLFYKKP
jgi:hypothetical protein